MLSCHGAPHNSVSSPYSPLSVKDATPDNTICDNDEHSTPLNHSPSAKRGAATKAQAGILSDALLLDTSDTIDISDSNSMPAFAPAPLPSTLSSRRLNKKELAISTSSSKSLHSLGTLGSQHGNTLGHPSTQATPPPLHNPLHGVAQPHDTRFADSNPMMLQSVFSEAPLVWDAAMGLPSPSTTGMTKSVTTSVLYSTGSPSLSLLQANDGSCVGERHQTRSTPPSTHSNGQATQRRASLADNSIRRSWTTRTLGGIDDNPLPTPTEQDFVFMDPSSLRAAMSTASTQQELTAMMAAASLPTPISAISLSRSLAPGVDGTNGGLLMPTIAQNVSIPSTGVQPAINPIDLGRSASSSLPADLSRHATFSLPFYDGKRASAPLQASLNQLSLPNGLQCQSSMKTQQPSARRGSKTGRSGTSKITTQGTGYVPMSAQALAIPGAPWPHAGGISIPQAPPFPSPISPDQMHSGANSGAHALQRQQTIGSTTSDLLGFHVPQKQNQYKPYHGPAPCGNPDPLYEYLASPTIVPGLEIIGHDYYGNYVQVLPICPDTSCSMNQDPIYLNLLQAIYAHTIPFLDLPPCSEEESRILLSGLSPSAIHPQSVQPPFLHLLPPKLPARGGANDPTRGWSGYYQTTLGGQTTALLNENDGVSNMQQATTLTSLAALLGPSSSSSASSVSASAATGTATAAAASSSPVTGPGLNRRASLPAFPPSSSQMGNNTAAAALLPPTNGRRSSTGSFPPPPSTLNNNNSANPNTNPNNPARKKKNMPRTHPYKSTSTHRDDNSMVMDTIMALSSSKSCGASVTGGLASLLGESRDVPDPKRKVVEKMVHMDETEYANHYLKHQRAMRKSASTTAVSLVQTMATAAHPMMTAKPSSLSSSLASSSSRPSSSGLQKQHGTLGSRRSPLGQEKSNHQQHQQHQDFSANTAIASSQHANVAAMDASDFIRAMTRSQYLHPSATNPATTTTGMPTPPILSATPQSDPGWTSTAELAELEKMMMSMDSASMAAFQAAASVISWPKWVDFKQLEQDMCESHTDSSNHATDRSSSIDHNSGTDNNNHHQEAPKLLLSSSTDLDMLDDPLVAEDTVAMTSLSLSDKTSTSPTSASSSSAPSSSSQHHETRRPKQEPHPTPDDMDCDPFVHIQTNSSTSGAHELPPLPTQVCDPQPPQSPSRSLIAPPPAPAALSAPAPAPAPAPQTPQAPQQQQQQHQQQQQQQQQRAVDSMEGLAQPYNSTILTVLPFAPEHSRPIFPTRGARRTGWYRSKAVASRGLSAITGVDYTTTCWYNVEQLEQIIKESIAASPITEINPLDSRTLEALTDPRASSSTAADNKSKPV